MSRGIGVEGLRAAVKRLEAMAGKSERCARCRLMTRNSRPRPGAAPAASRARNRTNVECEFCGREFAVKIEEKTKQGRAVSLLACAPLESQYTDPKANAYRYWAELVFGPGFSGGFFGNKAPARSEPPAGAHPGVRKLLALRAEAARLVERRRRRLAAQYGEEPFPRHAQLVRSLEERARRLYAKCPYGHPLPDVVRWEAYYKIRAELETVMTGRPLPDTASKLKKLRGAKAKVVRRARRELAAREEEQRRLQAEREERRRQEQAEREERRLKEAEREEEERRRREEEEQRERERQEQLAAAAPPPAPATSNVLRHLRGLTVAEGYARSMEARRELAKHRPGPPEESTR